MVYEETIPNSQSTISITQIVHSIASPFYILDLIPVYYLFRSATSQKPFQPALLEDLIFDVRTS